MTDQNVIKIAHLALAEVRSERDRLAKELLEMTKRAERTEAALREWQLGVGDTEMETRLAGVEAERDALAIRSEQLREAIGVLQREVSDAKHAEAILRDLREWFGAINDGPYCYVPDVLAWLDEREKRT